MFVAKKWALTLLAATLMLVSQHCCIATPAAPVKTIEKLQENIEVKPVAEPRDFAKDELREEDLQVLLEDAVDYAQRIALVYRSYGENNKANVYVSQMAPVSLFPSPFPKEQFYEALNIQKAINVLYFRMGSDIDWLLKVHADVEKADEHTRNLMDALREMKAAGKPRQPVTVMFQRADYMLNVVNDGDAKKDTKYELKQIEVNCGAIADTSTDRLNTELHRRMLQKAGVRVGKDVVPDNLPDPAMVEGLYLAWKHFNNPSAVIVIIGGTFPTYDHRKFEYQLEEKSNGQIKTVLVTPRTMPKLLKLDDDFTLRLVRDDRAVAVVYSRMCPMGYIAKKEDIAFRVLIERSTAIKVPTMSVALSSTKKVQQMLTLPGMVERFFPDPKDADTVKAIRKMFTGLWGLGSTDDETNRAMQDAIAHPDRYVLKPNRECGGNNIWGQDIADKLSTITEEERPAYILMQKLQPMVAKNYMLRPFKPLEFGETVSELGVYAVFMGNLHDGTELHNVQSGHLLKTKWTFVNEAGIHAGLGVNDTPYLF